MSETVILPSGAEIVIRDLAAVRQRDRKAVMVAGDPYEPGSMARVMAMSDRIIAVAVEKWTHDLPLPSEDIGVLDELTPEQYDEINRAVKPLSDALFPDFSPTPDRDTPTEP